MNYKPAYNVYWPAERGLKRFMADYKSIEDSSIFGSNDWRPNIALLTDFFISRDECVSLSQDSQSEILRTENFHKIWDLNNKTENEAVTWLDLLMKKTDLRPGIKIRNLYSLTAWLRVG